MVATLLDGLFLVILLVGVPVMSIAQLPLLNSATIQRIPAYLSSAVTILALGGSALGLGAWRYGLDGIGLTWPGLAMVAGWTVVLLGIAVILLAASRAIGRAMGLEESRILRELLPRTPKERWVFAGLSCCAGTGEELAYRGYATVVLASLTGSPLLAVLIANGPFAVVHAYQGGIGLARTYLLGVALGASFLATASLWPAMVAHTLIDLIGGLVVGDRFLEPINDGLTA